jgi:GDP-L-fucose synthase
MAQAKDEGRNEVVLWGTGTPRREFLHVDDCADALVHLMVHFSGEGPINVGSGKDVPIRELAEMIAKLVAFSGRIVFDSSYPDGTPRKLTNVGRINALGWSARIPLAQGLGETYAWFRKNASSLRIVHHAQEARWMTYA